jgi:hypothetical protein
VITTLPRLHDIYPNPSRDNASARCSCFSGPFPCRAEFSSLLNLLTIPIALRHFRLITLRKIIIAPTQTAPGRAEDLRNTDRHSLAVGGIILARGSTSYKGKIKVGVQMTKAETGG